jgi:hypothetical protein
VTTTPRCECGAALDDRLDWCQRCFAPRPESGPGSLPETAEDRSDDAPLEPSTAPSPGRPSASISPRRRASTLGRWDASVITFSLRGRIIATILLTLPLVWFLYFLVPFGFVGIVTYGVVYPRVMRDIWTRADRL